MAATVAPTLHDGHLKHLGQGRHQGAPAVGEQQVLRRGRELQRGEAVRGLDRPRAQHAAEGRGLHAVDAHLPQASTASGFDGARA